MITRSQIRNLVAFLNKIDHSRHYVLDISNGRCRVAYMIGDGLEWLSPRLSTGQLYEWIYAYKLGLAHGYELAESAK